MKTIAIATVVVFAMCFASCDKGDIEVKKLNRGEGIWTIESLLKEYFDTSGTHVDSSVTITDVGEFVFFKNTTLNGLFDEHFLVVNLNNSAGTVDALPGGVYYDDIRVKISTDAGCFLDGVWTIADNGRNKQVWHEFGLNSYGNLGERWTLTIKKK